MHKNSLKNLKPAQKGEVRNPNGRPNIGSRYSFVLPDELMQKLEARAKSEGVGRSEMLRRVLEDF